jgi:hypothetical protein
LNEERAGKCLRQVEHIRGHYPIILFRLDMGLLYHPAHRKNDVGEGTETTISDNSRRFPVNECFNMKIIKKRERTTEKIGSSLS